MREATMIKLATLGWLALAAGGIIPVVVGLSMGSHNSVGGRLAVIFVGASMISLAELALGKRIHGTPPVIVLRRGRPISFSLAARAPSRRDVAWIEAIR